MRERDLKELAALQMRICAKLNETLGLSQELAEAVRSIAGPAFSPEALTGVLLRFFRMTEEMPVLKLLNSGEVELLARKLPEEVVAEHFGHDTDIVEKILNLMPVRPGLDTKAISAAFHAIYFLTLHKKQIGEAMYEDALRILIDGVVRQMF